MKNICRKTLMTLALAAASLFVLAQEPASRPFFTAEELPDPVRCLPAPPAEGSPAFQYDLQRHAWGLQQRKDARRAAMVKQDAVWAYDALLQAFEEAFGLHISPDDTPQIWALMERSLRTIDPIRVAPKAYFHRIRPFEYFKEKTLTGEDDELRGEGSYPSGHTIRSWLAALLLSEINPAATDAISARAWTYGENRVIAGAHWQSDVDASRVAARRSGSRWRWPRRNSGACPSAGTTLSIWPRPCRTPSWRSAISAPTISWARASTGIWPPRR